MITIRVSYICLVLSCFFYSCEEEKVKGCTDPKAQNYSEEAEEDNGECYNWRDAVIGNFSSKSYCAIDTPLSKVKIAKNAEGNELVNLIDFPMPGDIIKASVSPLNHIYYPNTSYIDIASQYIFPEQDSILIHGYGLKSSQGINFLLYLKEGSEPERSCFIYLKEL